MGIARRVGRNGGKRVALFDYRNKAAILGAHRLNILIHCGSDDIALGIVFSLGDELFLGALFVVVGNDTENGVSNDFVVTARDRVVSVVLSVDLAVDDRCALCCEVLVTEERTRSVGEEVVTGKGVGLIVKVIVRTRAHVGENAEVGELIERFGETESVYGNSRCEAPLVKRILNGELEECGSLVARVFVTRGGMVVVKILECVLRHIGLDERLNVHGLGEGGVGREEIDGVLLGYRVEEQHLVLQRLGGSLVEVLTVVVCSQLVEKEPCLVAGIDNELGILRFVVVVAPVGFTYEHCLLS